MPMVKLVARGYTACVDAYLTPHIKRYISGFSEGFSDNLKNTNVLFMQSDGGLTPMAKYKNIEIYFVFILLFIMFVDFSFNGSRAILSGPAGGVVGYAMTTYEKETNLPVIGEILI